MWSKIEHLLPLANIVSCVFCLSLQVQMRLINLNSLLRYGAYGTVEMLTLGSKNLWMLLQLAILQWVLFLRSSWPHGANKLYVTYMMTHLWRPNLNHGRNRIPIGWSVIWVALFTQNKCFGLGICFHDSSRHFVRAYTMGFSSISLVVESETTILRLAI